VHHWYIIIWELPYRLVNEIKKRLLGLCVLSRKILDEVALAIAAKLGVGVHNWLGKPCDYCFDCSNRNCQLEKN